MSTSAMDVDNGLEVKAETAANYTILRIKRKRTDEPLDALVIDAKIRKKKTKGGLDVFQFAETVEEDAWNDEQRTKALQERISTLARDRVKCAEKKAAEAKHAALEVYAVASCGTPTRSRQYKIVSHGLDTATEARGSPKLGAPHGQEQQRARDFRLFDAVPMAEASLAASQTQEDGDMANFLPLLQKYLKINDIDPSVECAGVTKDTSAAFPGDPVPISAPAPLPPTDDPDYVWDVFYHRAGLADDYEEKPNVNIATLTGLPASFDDFYSSDEESEHEDEADEDSNAEEYYKNDYPDEDSDDSGSSDMFHEHSEGDEW